MDKKIIILLLVISVIFNSFCVISVFASNGSGTTYDFSSSSNYLGNNIVNGIQDNAIVKGQYGKGTDDNTLRMYSVGGSYYTDEASQIRNNQYITFTPGLSSAIGGQYVHVSFEYLRENLYCGLNVTMNIRDSENTLLKSKYLLQQLPENSNYIKQGRILPNAKNPSGYNYTFIETLGTWNKIDVFFSTESNIATTFLNGNRVDMTLNTTWGGANFIPGVTNIESLMFHHVIDTKTSHASSAVQIDNVIVENVSEVPQSISYKRLGETINFDDNACIYGTSSYASYGTSWYDGNQDVITSRFADYASGRPAVRFQNKNVFSMDGGIYGKPSWDKSLCTSIPSDSSAYNSMWYCPGISDISPGEIAHLTFSVANSTSEQGTGVKTRNMVLGNDTLSEVTLFEMSDENGRFSFFDNEIDIKWEHEKWYKIDILFHSLMSGTNVDCFINGKKVLSEHYLSSNSMSDVGTLYFADSPNAHYYLDDISYGRFTSTTFHNPAYGYFIIDTDDTYIDNNNHTIAIPNDCDIADFVALLTEAENVVTYNYTGAEIYKGVLDSSVTLKLSNNFGGGVYYNIGYKTPKLSVKEITYNKNTRTLSATAGIDFGIKENQLHEDTVVPSCGTLVLAVYNDGQMENITSVPYSNLTEYEDISASMKMDFTHNKVAKAFILDSLHNLTPLTPAQTYLLKEEQDSEDEIETVENGDVFVASRKVGSYFDFEEDDYWFKDDADFDTWYLGTSPNGNSIEVKTEENGNHYLSLDSVNTTNNSFFCAISIYNGQYIIEADVRTPTMSSVLFTAHDDAKNSGVFLSCLPGSGAISMNNQTFGYLNQDEWVRVGIAVDTDKKTLNYYINGEYKGGNIPLPSNLGNIVSLRMECARSHAENTLMLDNIIVYSGTKPYDFSEMFKGKVDENTVSYEHNTEGVLEFLNSYNAINTDSGKIYVNSLDSVSKTPYYQDGKLMVSFADAQKLVLGLTNTANTDRYVSLDDFANQYGKVVTYTRTDTVLVGENKVNLSDNMIKYVNAFVTYDRPDKETLKSSFTGARPRATINGMKLQQIKDNYGKDKYITMWVDQMIATANSLLDAPLQQFTPPGGTDARLMMAARNAGWAVQRLAIAYHLTGGTNQAYVDRAWAEIENACNYPHWHHQWNDLDPAYMVCAMSYGYDWFYDQWSPEQRKKIEDAVWKFQLDLAYQSYHGYKYNAWATVLTNWNVIINGYNAMAASVFFESNPDKSADIIENAVRCMEVALGEFYPNGAWGEGNAYLNATVKPLGEVIYTFKNTFGSHFNLHNAPCLDMTCNYFVSTTGPKGTNNFNDAGVIVSPTIGSFFWMSDVFDAPEFTSLRLIDIDKGLATDENVYELMFYNPDIQHADADIPLDSYVDDIELVSLREKNNDENSAWVSFHSGEGLAGQNHSHIDAGTFVIDMLGERFASDLGNHYYYSTGWGNVVKTQPIGDTLTRWDYYQNIPEGHNTLLINPKDEDIGQNILASDKMECYVSKESGAYAITSLSSAYKGYADNVRRGIMLSDERRSITIRDEIDLFDGDNEVYWFMHTTINNDIEFVDDRTAIMSINGKKVKLSFITNADTAEMYEAECPSTINFTLSPEQRPIEDYKKLTIKMKAKDKLYIQVKFIPLDDPMANIQQENIILDNWNISN